VRGPEPRRCRRPRERPREVPGVRRGDPHLERARGAHRPGRLQRGRRRHDARRGPLVARGDRPRFRDQLRRPRALRRLFAMISFREVSKRFGSKVVLDGVTFDVPRGEISFIIGASGAGKSVLIKHVTGFVRPDAGEIWLDDLEVSRLGERELASVRKRCALVFQHATLFDSQSCLENVALPLEKHGRGRTGAEIRARARALLARVHMEPFADRYPSELGEGMKKRVAIARALALDPEYVLFDEPTTGLDPVNARRVDRLIQTLSREGGVTSLVVSHDLTSIFGIADRIVMLYKGRVRLIGSPDDFRQSDDPVVRQFVRGEAEGPMDA